MKCIVAILAFIQCCCAETLISTTAQFQHFVYEAGWRANAGYYDKNKQKDKWYNAKTYEDSIYKVIPQAIADCMQGEAEFGNVGKIVTFEANNPEKYDAANWNAVVLWNYLYFAIDGEVRFDDTGVSAVGAKLKTYYGEKYWGFIKEAVSDIQTYAKDLNLYDYIAEIKDNEDDNRYYKIEHTFNEYTKEAQVDITGIANITINKSKPTTKVYEKQDATKVPTSEEEIHALPNFAHIYNDKGVDISANKCWFNSVMLNLYNSKTFHKVINELQAKSKDNTMPSYWIQQIFNDIRSGDMTKYGDHLRGLIKAIQDVNIKQRNDKSPERTVAPINSNIENSGDIAYILIVDSLKLEGEIKGIKAHSKWEISYENELGGTEIVDRIYVYEEQEDVKAALNDTIYSYDETIEYEDGKKETNHITLKNQNLPKLLVFIRDELRNKNPLRTPSILDLESKDGMHRYRLIGVVEDDPGIVHHFEAQVKIEEKWYRVNDQRTPSVKQIPFNERSTLRQLAFYEEEK